MANVLTVEHGTDGVATTLSQLTMLFPNDHVAMRWLESIRWPDELRCAFCDGNWRLHRRPQHPTMPYYCGPCLRNFSLRSNTIMQHRKASYRVWVTAIHLLSNQFEALPWQAWAALLGVRDETAWKMMRQIHEVSAPIVGPWQEPRKDEPGRGPRRIRTYPNRISLAPAQIAEQVLMSRPKASGEWHFELAQRSGLRPD